MIGKYQPGILTQYYNNGNVINSVGSNFTLHTEL